MLRSRSSAIAWSVVSVNEPAIRPGAPAGASDRETAAQEPAIAAILVADSMLVFEELRVAGQVRLQAGLEAADVLGMNPVEPVFRTRNPCVRCKSDHRSPSS